MSNENNKQKQMTVLIAIMGVLTATLLLCAGALIITAMVL